MKKKMPKKKMIYLLIFLAIILAILLFYQKNKNPKYALINGHRIQLEIAKTDQQKQKGLGDREGLCGDCGMLFLFDKKGEYNFWMKGMRFPLDIIWISDGKIVHMEQNVSYYHIGILNPSVQADMVLEINSDKSREFDFKIDDSIHFLGSGF